MRSIIIAGAALAFATAAHATVIVKAAPSNTATANGLKSSYSGVTTITFDDAAVLPPAFQGGPSSKAALVGCVPHPTATPRTT